MRWIVALLLSLFAVTAAHAQCSTAFPKGALNSQVQSFFPDNTVGAITPLTMRTFEPNEIQSFQQFPGTSIQNGTAYTVKMDDYGQLLIFTNASPIAVTLQAANTAGFCPFNFYVIALAGNVTITPMAGKIANASNVVVTGGESIEVRSDGTNWQSINPTNIVNNGVINNGTGNALAYYAVTGHTLSALGITNNAVVVTDGSGVPSESTTLPSSLSIGSPTFTGTVTGPDSGTWSSGGLNGVVIGGVTAENATFSTLNFTTLSAASLAASPSTITGLTINNSPSGTNDYIAYFHAGTNTIERATVASVGSAATAGVSSLNGTTGALTIPQATSASGTTVSIPVPMPGGRVTLQAHTPVMTTNQINVSTLRYDCYRGNVVPYFNGTNDLVDTIAACEVSTAMQASSTGVLNANEVFDVWWEGNSHHNICIATNGSGAGWSGDTFGSNTARGTGYSALDITTRSYPTNGSTVAHCYNGSTDYGSLAANRLSHLGTIYTSGAGQVTWQFGGEASTGTAGFFGVWNTYNRVNVASSSIDNGSSYIITGTSWRESHNGTGMQVTAVFGIAEDGFSASFNSSVLTVNLSGATAFAGIGLDSTTLPTGNNATFGLAGTNGGATTLSPIITWLPGVGIHTVAALSKGDGTHSNIYNQQSSDTFTVSGLRM